jgi:hypothetical protein
MTDDTDHPPAEHPAAELYRKLRSSTKEMLELGDDASITPVQSLQIDLVNILRLEIDGLTATSLAGKATDLGKLSETVKLLRLLLPQSAVAEAAALDVVGARAELGRFLDQQAAALEAQDERMSIKLREEVAELKQIVAGKDAVIASLGGDLANRSPKSGEKVATTPPKTLPPPHPGFV